MKVVVFGSGLMGSAIARDIVKSSEVDEVVVCDIDRKRLNSLRQVEPSQKLSVKRHDVTRGSETIKLLKMLKEDLGFAQKDIRVFYSGHRGYHVHVESEAVQTLDAIARKEIVDYLTGL